MCAPFGVRMTCAEVRVPFDKTEAWTSPESEPLEKWTRFRAQRGNEPGGNFGFGIFFGRR